MWPITCIALLLVVENTKAFSVPQSIASQGELLRNSRVAFNEASPAEISSSLFAASSGGDDQGSSIQSETEIGFSRDSVDVSVINLDQVDEKPKAAETAAATNTVNERLLAELQAAENKEKFGARSSAGRKLGLVDGYGRPRKTDAEIEAAIAEARDLNGVNPVVAILGSFFALGVAAGLWYATGQLGNFFALNPVESETYFVIRSAQVVRNVAMGLISLASGFFGVTGLGIFLLGVRVAYGVITGELDPTPIKQNQKKDKVDLPNIWALMMGKKPNRRGSRGGGTDNNPFGL